ncbi:F-actin-capping protein subunit alpha [Camellia lanceoleosa]|uniref:F-actin-capping protein subunit alpha n=1 Tax=Camellia lanceoleosa TaxID=1840588 RepID=A0ACC0IYI0_9ERIC|nr:F-actin-capping protein subunit alpha [Camellia lanceoleosa]
MQYQPTKFLSADDSAISLTNIIRHHETEYLAALQASYSNLPVSVTTNDAGWQVSCSTFVFIESEPTTYINCVCISV